MIIISGVIQETASWRDGRGQFSAWTRVGPVFEDLRVITSIFRTVVLEGRPASGLEIIAVSLLGTDGGPRTV